MVLVGKFGKEISPKTFRKKKDLSGIIYRLSIPSRDMKTRIADKKPYA
jgi:hypothetical protein